MGQAIQTKTRDNNRPHLLVTVHGTDTTIHFVIVREIEHVNDSHHSVRVDKPQR